MRNTAGVYTLRKPGQGPGCINTGLAQVLHLRENNTMSDKTESVDKVDQPKTDSGLNQQLWKEMSAVATRDQSEDPTKNKQQTMHSLSEALKANWYALDADKNGFVTLPEIEFYEKHKAPDSQTKQALSFFRENGGLVSQYASDAGKAGVSQAQMGISEADRKVFDIITDPNQTRLTIAARELAGGHFWTDSIASGLAGAGLGSLTPLGARGLMATGRIAETGILGRTLTSVGARSPWVGAAVGAAVLAGVGTYAAYKWHQSTYENKFRNQQTDLFKLTLPTHN